MKKFILFLTTLILYTTAVFAQAEAGPNTGKKSNSHNNKALMPLEFSYDLADSISLFNPGSTTNGNAGVIYFNKEFWVSKWATDTIVSLDSTGKVLSLFTIPGITGIRSFTTDGTTIFAGNATDNIYAINPTTRTLDSTIVLPSTSVGSRMTTYDPTANGGAGGFWIANFSSDIQLYSRTGQILDSIPEATHDVPNIYGGAVDTASAGGPYLLLYSQGPASEARIEVISIATGLQTGHSYNTLLDLASTQNSAGGIAGGLFISNSYIPGENLIMGVLQGDPDILFGYNDEIPNCPQPTNLSASYINATDLSVDWTTGGASIWNMEYGLKGFTPGTGTKISNISSKPYTLNVSSLVQSSTYEIYIEDSCGVGQKSFWSEPVEFATPCSVETAPFLEDFTLGTLPDCWTQSAVTGGPWVFGGTSNPDFGSTYAMPDHTNSNAHEYTWVDFSGTDVNVILETPEIDISSLTSPAVDFWIVSHNSSGSVSIYNKLFIEAFNGTSFVIIDSIQGDFGLQWENFTYDLTNYSYGTNLVKLRFRAESGGDGNDFDNDLLLDDVAVKNGPTCYNPNSISAQNITADSLNIKWNERNSASQWQIEYDTMGFSLGTGTSLIVNSDSIKISGLSPTTAYDFYVRSICSVGDSSSWSGPFSFLTPCDPDTILPFVENFDASSTPSCWIESGDNSWDYSEGAGYGAANVSDHTGNNGNYAWMDGSDNGAAEVSSLTTVSIDISSLTTPMLDYWVFSNNVDDAALNKLIVDFYDGNSWHQVDSIEQNLGPNWVERIIDLSIYTITGPVKIRFTVTGSLVGSPFYNDILLDDIAVMETPTCWKPTSLSTSNLTDTSAELNWVENNIATEWEIEYGLTGYTQGNGNSSIVFTNPTKITGLSPTTTYDFYVRTVCGRGDTSLWVGPFTFETPCAPDTILPFIENFDASSTPSCWMESGDNSWDYSLGADYGAANVNDHTGNNGNYAWMDGSDNGSAEVSSLTTVPIDISSLTTPMLNYWVFSNNVNDAALNKLIVDFYDGSSWHQVDSIEQNLGANWVERIIDLSIYTITGAVKVRFTVTGSLVGNPIYNDILLDDIVLMETPTCWSPTSLSTSNITATTVELNWVENNIATEWEIEYGLAGFTQGNGNTSIVFTNPTKITGLTAGTTYDFYVRSVCGRSDTSLWEGPFTFTTASRIPYFQDFESFGSSTAPIDEEGWINTSTSGPEWQSGSSTSSGQTGPNFDHTIGSGGIFVYLETSSGALGNTSDLLSPPIYVDSGMSTIEMSFWYHKYGATMGDLEVYIDTNGVSNLLTTIPGETQFSETDPWLNYSVYLRGYEGKSFRLRFKGYRGSSFTGDMSIDDVFIRNVVQNDAGVAEIVYPADKICPGTITPIVSIGNYGWDTLKTVKVKYSINGALDSVQFNGTILPNTFQNVSLNSISLSSGTNYDIIIYTEGPNNAIDTINVNDTLSLFNLKTGLNGAYTIDTSMAISFSNYHNFTSIANDLNNFGVCGPVTVSIAPGTYNDYLYLSEIGGTSAINNILFDGGDSSTTILTHDGNTSFATLTLDGADHVTIKNMTVEATGSSSSVTVLFANQADHNILSNNILKANTSSTSSTVVNVLFSGSPTSSTTGAMANYNTISNNQMIGGYYGVRLYGSSSDLNINNIISNNNMSDVYYYGIYTYYQDSLLIEGNKIDMTTRGNSNADGIYLYYPHNSIISGNFVHAPDYGVYYYRFTDYASLNRTEKIINNMIISETDYGLYVYYVDSMDIYHNTITVHGTSTPALQISSNSSHPMANYNVVNNILYSTNTQAIETNEPHSMFANFDHNLFYSGGSDLINIDGTNYGSLAAYQAAYPFSNTASVVGKPRFTAVNDLHLIDNLPNNKGDNSVGITVDIDGDARPIGTDTIVDIGADEYETLSCPAPYQLGIFNKNLTSVSVHWTGGSNEYQYEFGTSGYTQGSNSIINTLDDTIIISGLSPSTTYDFYLREICSPGDTSPWIGPFNFKTLNGIPFFEDFETFGSSTAAINQQGWINTSTSTPEWESNTTTSSTQTGPTHDHTIGSGGTFVFLECSGGSLDDSSDLVSPSIIVDSSYTTLEFSFWYHKYGQTMGDLKVYIDTNGVSNLITTIPGETHFAETDPWTEFSTYLTGYEGKNIRLRFRGIRGSNYYSDMSVDDVYLNDVPPIDAMISVNTPINAINECYTTSENVSLNLTSIGTDSLDFTVDTTSLTVNVSGAITQTLNVVLDDNTINSGNPMSLQDSIVVNMGTIDMSNPGNYYFTATLNMASDGELSNNVYLDTIVVLPSSGGNIIGPDSNCLGDSVSLLVDNYVGDIQWQTLVSGTWTNIPGATSSEIKVSPGNNTSYRNLTCATFESDTLDLTVVSLSAPSTINDSQVVACGNSGNAYLEAISSNPNPKFAWFDAPVGGNKVQSGGNLSLSADGDSLSVNATPTGPNSPAIDTFYVEEVVSSGQSSSTLLITEAAVNTPDALEIQNVSSRTIDVTGWKVVASEFGGINNMNTVIQTLSGTIAPNGILEYNDQTTSSLYWGSNLNWTTGGGNWLLILDDQYNIVDFVVWGYSLSDIQNMSITVNSNVITPGTFWTTTAGIDVSQATTGNSMTRIGNMDYNDSLDFTIASENFGTQYSGLKTPFPGGDCTSPRAMAISVVECIPIPDLSVNSLLNPISSNECYSTSEPIEVLLVNPVGRSVLDFTTDSFDITVNVSGAATQTLNYKLNNNALNAGVALSADDSLIVPMGNFNMSNVGSYSFEVYISSLTDTVNANDTIRRSISNNASGGNLSASMDTICGSELVSLQTSGSIGDPQWQRLVAGTFVNEMNADSTSYEVLVDSTVSFRLLACGVAVSDTLTIVSNPLPAAPSVVNDTAIVFCGDSGTAVPTASTSVSGTIVWYSDSNSTSLLATGTSINFGLQTSFQATTTLYTDTFYVRVIDGLTNCESDYSMVTGTVVCTVGEEDMPSALKGIAIFPNPSKGVFQLIGNNITDELEVSIYNTNGKMVYQMDSKVSNNFNETIDLSNLSKGIYFVKLQGKDSMEMKKLVIQ